MEKYIGIKIISAEPMNLGEAIKKEYYTVKPSSDINKEEEGYHVVYTDGYNSWCPKDIFETNNSLLVDATNIEIIKGMVSPNYKERFKSEYLQLKQRTDKLHNLLAKWETLSFTPICSKELLTSQYTQMSEYLNILEARAALEEIEL